MWPKTRHFQKVRRPANLTPALSLSKEREKEQETMRKAVAFLSFVWF